ncbi:hypothetical protein GRX03_04465 [Halovenus sp. WSH3]|uniref:Uncharacterized protein n=1 Tax=Halovenus carboxidivorans TaxID=2692199 RepID=A0A6B0T7J4_9EURY|nr:hypothetical protein [Halovenus carboxidivorans]MXR50860.1 hypothetical protein [Halovenus carboxidivorans]
MKATDYELEDERSPELCVDCDVTAHTSCPDRVVFTEQGNTDGWISTDYTVELPR